MNNSNLITDDFLVPSMNKLYGKNFDGHLTLRAMTTDEERIRLSGQNFWETMRIIINECIVDNKDSEGNYRLDSAAFTDWDFFAICVKLRILSYGPEYKTTAVCPICGKQFKHVVDLSELIYNFLPDDFQEPYEIGPLPSSGDTLGCRFIRIKDRLDVEKKKMDILAKNKNYIGDPTYNLEMERRIVTVNGVELDPIQAEKYVHSMIARDSDYYHQMVDKNSYGVVRLGSTRCENSECGGEALYVLRADREFFRSGVDY